MHQIYSQRQTNKKKGDVTTMTNEEIFIKKKIGGSTPFRVPEGYFDQLVSQITAQLPEETTEEKRIPAVVKYLRPLLYAAACICLGIFGTAIYMNSNNDEGSMQLAQQENMVYSDSYIDEAADYAMIDNEDIYASLLADM